MGEKVRIKYKHPVKADVELEIVGSISEVTENSTFVTRIDGYVVDIPTANIIKQEILI